MNRFYSVRIDLEEMIKNVNYEISVIEKLYKCKLNAERAFKVIFYYENLNEKDIKEFVKRHEDSLFKLHADITNKDKIAWFCISKKEKPNTKRNLRYYYRGDIMSGLDFYIKLIVNINKRENDESSYRR
jgi:hypothetical protein